MDIEYFLVLVTQRGAVPTSLERKPEKAEVKRLGLASAHRRQEIGISYRALQSLGQIRVPRLQQWRLSDLG